MMVVVVMMGCGGIVGKGSFNSSICDGLRW